MGTSHYKWPFSIAMLVYQRVLLTQCSVAGVGEIPAIHRGDECCKHHSNERGMREAGTVPVQAPGSSGAFQSQTLAQKRQSLFFSPPHTLMFLSTYGCWWNHQRAAVAAQLEPRIRSSILVEVLCLGLGRRTWNCLDAWYHLVWQHLVWQHLAWQHLVWQHGASLCQWQWYNLYNWDNFFLLGAVLKISQNDVTDVTGKTPRYWSIWERHFP